MKSLIIFYSVCILMFYSLIAYIGNRNKNSDPNSGLLEDVTVSNSDYKISKARLLSQNFDNAIIYNKMGEAKLASKEIYKAITLLAVHNTVPQYYARITLNKILKNLSTCYIDLERNNNISPATLNRAFETSELFIAYGYIQRSKHDIKLKHKLEAMENINKAQECLALSAKYAKGEDLKTHVNLLKETKELLNTIAPETIRTD